MLVLSPSHGGGTTMKIGTILSLALFCSHNGSHAQQYMTGDVNYTSALAEGLIDPVVLANCPEDSANWGKTTCTPPASFDVVPAPYQDLPLMKNNEKWQDLRPLEEYELVPDDVNNADGTTTHTVTLQLTPAYYLGPSYNTPLMTYNGLSPSPLIRVKAGDVLRLQYENGMTMPLGTNVHNAYRLPNTTNLHLHGGHISGMDPGDNVKVEIAPGQQHTYEYTFPKNHMPGTSWYHPHFHGSTSIQTGMGVAGMVIVEDPPGYVPAQIAQLPEINLMIQHLNLDELSTYANVSGFEWWQADSDATVYGNASSSTGNTNLMLINMQYIPKITVERGKWYRMRMVMSSVMDGLAWTTPEGCELQLLAKDGIYLMDAPRRVPAMILAPGNRADVALRCDIETEPGVYKMKSVSRGRYFAPINPNAEDQYEQADPNVPATCAFCVTQPNVAALNIVAGDATENEPDLLPFGADLNRPCYLADLMNVPEEDLGEEFELDYGGGMSVNNVPFVNETTYTKNYTMGTVQRIFLLNNGGHPHHQHVNPFQIYSIENRTAFQVLQNNTASMTDGDVHQGSYQDWYKDGDWQDTLQHISKDAKTHIRWAVDTFSGDMIFHCHILAHEDQGMMGQFWLDGVEGDTYSQAKVIDPSCASQNTFLRAGNDVGVSDVEEESPDGDATGADATAATTDDAVVTEPTASEGIIPEDDTNTTASITVPEDEASEPTASDGITPEDDADTTSITTVGSVGSVATSITTVGSVAIVMVVIVAAVLAM